VLALALLALAIGSLLWPRPRLPAWSVPVATGIAAVALGVGPERPVADVLGPLVGPLLFLVTAVPFAVLVDRAGTFGALAGLLARRRRSPWALWVLAAVVTATLNLDVAVVLLTPVYLRLAPRSTEHAWPWPPRQIGGPPAAMAAVPVLAALLASSALPVSNLTNLIAVERLDLGAGRLLVHLGLPTLAAVAVGWWCFRRWAGGAAALEPTSAITGERDAPADGSGTDPDRAWSPSARWGGAVLGVVVAAFVAGPPLGVEPWIPALAGCAALGALEHLLGRGVPRPPSSDPPRPALWRAVPVGLVGLVCGLAVLAAAVADASGLADRSPGDSLGELATTLALGAVGANLVNNLSAFLVGLEAVAGGAEQQAYALLLAVNAGPGLVLTGSLSTLLWVELVRARGHVVGARWFLGLGLAVVAPAYLAAAAVLLAQAALLP
jgi:arsenical pump membrane protein